jgi:hypothetical protein
MLKGLGDIGQIMKLQKEFKNVQKRLKKAEAAGESMDGAVRAVVNGENVIVDLQIAEDFLKKADKKTLEKAILSAVNTAVERSKGYAAEEMAKLTGGLNIPGLDSFLK